MPATALQSEHTARANRVVRVRIGHRVLRWNRSTLDSLAFLLRSVVNGDTFASCRQGAMYVIRPLGRRAIYVVTGHGEFAITDTEAAEFLRRFLR